MHEFRLIIDVEKPRDAAMNMAIDETVYNFVTNGKSPSIIRFYRFEPSCVSIGRQQSSSIINMHFCDGYKIGYVRRPSGGNAVYHHEKDITYSVAGHNALFGIRRDEIYRTICGWVIDAINQLGINAVFHGKNDIVVDGKKVCGNAMIAGKRSFMQHGSLFLYSNANHWRNCLRIDESRISDIKCLSDIVKKPGRIERDLLGIMERSFTQNSIVNGNYQIGGLTPDELREAEKLADEKYRNLSFLLDESKTRKGDACILDIRDD